jgi:uncharacterized protein YgbK (DUF1537 family)
MSKHPSTPADESDLRIHLARQTDQKIGLLSVLDLELPLGQIIEKITALCKTGNQVILFDTLTNEHLLRIGEILEHSATAIAPLFSVGSSSVEKALVSKIPNSQPGAQPPEKPNGPTLVLSGSRSAVTAGQIRHAMNIGFAECPLNVALLLDKSTRENETKSCAQRVCKYLNDGKNVILHTAALDQPIPHAENSAQILGSALGIIADEILRRQCIGRLILAGGDSSGHATQALGIDSVEMLAPLWPGAPLCRAHSRHTHINHCEIVLKGGQVGDDRFFERASNPRP